MHPSVEMRYLNGCETVSLLFEVSGGERCVSPSYVYLVCELPAIAVKVERKSLEESRVCFQNKMQQ